MKLSAYHRSRGDYVRFVKGEDKAVGNDAWDRVYVTTLFSFEWERTSRAVDYAILSANNQSERVFVGGIAASLMRDEFIGEPRWAGVRFIQGLLDGPPAKALHLSLRDGEFGAEDQYGTPIEERVPDYGILDHIEYTYPVRDAYFGYASRGCIRKCAFCGVPKLEGDQRDMPPLSQLVLGVIKEHGEKKDLVLMDNNVAASGRYQEVIAEIRDLGFTPGARLHRPGQRAVKRRVDFNQGVDARILAKSPMYLREMATICISPLRIAFDHMGVRRVYERAIRMAADNSITSLSNYMLYNFMDTPSDLYQRMRLNIELNEELGIRIWSFPMRYQPVNLKDRSHVGKNWNRYYLRSFQIMLQATRGIVSGSPTFFRRAYGEGAKAFEYNLSLPHAFVFHRDYFESGGGSSVRDEYETLRRKLSRSQEDELLHCLNGSVVWSDRYVHYQRILDDSTVDTCIRNLIRFHVMRIGDSDYELGARTRWLHGETAVTAGFQEAEADEEIVEDAGLFDHEGTGGASAIPSVVAGRRASTP